MIEPLKRKTSVFDLMAENNVYGDHDLKMKLIIQEVIEQNLLASQSILPEGICLEKI